jgi:hypothetical protein
VLQSHAWQTYVSWPGLARPPTTVFVASGKVVGDRAEPGHDTERYDRSSVDSVIPPQTLRGVRQMRMAGLSAEASLYKTTHHYRTVGTVDTAAADPTPLRVQSLGGNGLGTWSSRPRVAWLDLISHRPGWRALAAPIAGLTCNGICATVPCTVSNPCDFGILGKFTSGRRCASEGSVCDPGTLWDCNCTTKIDWLGSGLPYCPCSATSLPV